MKFKNLAEHSHNLLKIYTKFDYLNYQPNEQNNKFKLVEICFVNM